ncbi:hypothetical protein ACFSTC_46000 [Nonomuraea ferruginea]
MRSLLLLAGLVLTGALLFTVFGVAAAPAERRRPRPGGKPCRTGSSGCRTTTEAGPSSASSTSTRPGSAATRRTTPRRQARSTPPPGSARATTPS